MSFALRLRIAGHTLAATLALAFGWFGVGKFLRPVAWGSWMPEWLDGFMGMPQETWLKVLGVKEIIIALLIICPIRIVRFIGAVIAALYLFIILTQIGWNDIAVRDVGLLGSAVALALLSWKEND